jgi:hypothetical protein
MSIQFLERELTQIFPTVLNTTRDELRFYNGVLVPVLGQLPDGVEFIKQYRQDYTGIAARYNGIANDIPTVDVLMTSHSWTAAQWAISVNWSELEVAQYQYAQSSGQITRQFGVVQLKTQAAANVIGESINKAVAFGDTNFKGFLNHSDVTLATETTSPYTLSITALYEYLKGLAWFSSRRSLLPPGRFSLLLPPDLYQKLTTPFFLESPSITPMALLTDSTKGIYFADVEMLPELSYSMLEDGGVHAAGTNKDRLIVYERHPDTVTRYTAPLRTTSPLQTHQLHWNIAMHQRSSEIMVRQPLRIFYRDFAKAA